jgi:hypothetical protein
MHFLLRRPRNHTKFATKEKASLQKTAVPDAHESCGVPFQA